MAVEEETIAPRSIHARIAALNINQVGTPIPNAGARGGHSIAKAAGGKKPPPPPLPPKRHEQSPRSESADIPLKSNGVATARRIGHGTVPARQTPLEILPPPGVSSQNGAAELKPALPRRPQKSPTAEQPPSLPARRPSEAPSSRRASIESTCSAVSGKSSLSSIARANGSVESLASTTSGRIKAPPYDPSTLPPLPEKRAKDEGNKPALPNRRSTSRLAVEDTEERPPLPSRTRTAPGGNASDNSRPSLPKRSALDWAMNKDAETPPQLPRRGQNGNSAAPPPIPLSSRPDLGELNKTKPHLNGASNGASALDNSKARCLICRDFQAVDEHAARFPRQSIPSNDMKWLAHQLTSPFPAHVDKARAIFTWTHHNVEYDCKAIIDKSTRAPMTAENTIARGLAVCEGYANVFHDLGVAAGLEVEKVNGHGKGTGYAGATADRIPPPNPSGHAWNAVKIEVNPEVGPSAGMYWKLIDPCWGAGSVNNYHEGYIKGFKPAHFIMSNDEFGIKHFPADERWFCRSDGRPWTWEQYILSDVGKKDGPKTWSFEHVEPGMDDRTFQPTTGKIPLHDPNGGPTVRFAVRRKCPHWDPLTNGIGKSYLFLVKVGDRPGYLQDQLPMKHDGYNWWLDVPRRELGKPGELVDIRTVGTMGEKDGKGLTEDEFYRLMKSSSGITFNSILAQWELV
ncbi:hypothetical protein P152DRAFT_455005 [Eremomyces bilateralis CBS 781.70]|uniref:Transglutaminase-like domain-containing protein n=1 Tax=Eremomyces bilateralis CBS 781.70 TaxID=1392243 RepID=A0A6G1GB38_9PEZI|nr:uncharacterized protein P152DRAFT_455005 [Eremomyces bilateralis CBS 781.70]KAF1815285.1 hypothetical protein P152DRAFT_455005 [Eremomyces bilateralis CBS 781.70]